MKFLNHTLTHGDFNIHQNVVKNDCKIATLIKLDMSNYREFSTFEKLICLIKDIRVTMTRNPAILH